jgi:hypothetical protein
LFYRHLTESDRKAAKKVIAVEMEKIHQSTTSTRAASSSRLSSVATTNIGTQSTLDVFDEFDRLCGLKPAEKLSVTLKQLSINEEISFFIKAVHSAYDFQRFWITHQATLPRLTILVRRFNICPATSVASESTFSVAGYLQRKQRASLSSSAMRYSIVLKNKTALNKLKPLVSSNNATG